MFSNVIVDLTISGRSFVFSQWMAFVADIILPQLGYHCNFKSCKNTFGNLSFEALN